jgi:biopolymer transport protein ExbB
MSSRNSEKVWIVSLWAGVVVFWFWSSSSGYADGPSASDRAAARSGDGIAAGAVAIGGEDTAGSGELTERVRDGLGRLRESLVDWYRRTPPLERVTWGGLAACGGMGLIVLGERLVRLRRRRVVPPDFTARFLDRLHEGRLECGQALDHCELNPSPAARVALAAVRRWGRPAGDLERAVALTHRVETERLRRNVGTLRRVAVMAPLLGVLGTLSAVGRALEAIPLAPASGGGPILVAPAPSRNAPLDLAWGPALAAALTPLSTGIVIATLSLVAYDAVLVRVEKLAGALDRLGAETIEAIALSAPASATPIIPTPVDLRRQAAP